MIADGTDGILYGGVKTAFSTKVNRESMAGFHSTSDNYFFLGCSEMFSFFFFINGASWVLQPPSCVL